METITRNLFAPGAEGLLAPLKPFMDDATVNEILINQPGEVFVERRGVMTLYLMPELTPSHIKRLFGFIANENGQVLNKDFPMLSGNLYDGSRVQLVIPPAAREYTLSIRRPSLLQRTLEDYKHSHFYDNTRSFDASSRDCNPEDVKEKLLLDLYHQQLWGDFIELAVVLKKNIVISGGTGTGKTTFLNACLCHIPQDTRIITLEDTFEVVVPHNNAVSLSAPKTKDESKISMQDLVQCALRLRPDRIIMGEIRGREILDFVSACSTGHEGSITSIHANNPRIAFMRMTQLYKLNNVPSMRDADIARELHAVIDIVIQVARNHGQITATAVYYKNAHPHFIFND